MFNCLARDSNSSCGDGVAVARGASGIAVASDPLVEVASLVSSSMVVQPTIASKSSIIAAAKKILLRLKNLVFEIGAPGCKWSISGQC